MEFMLFIGFLGFHIKNKKARKVLLYTGICFTVFYISFSALASNKDSIDSIQIGIETIIVLLFSYYYLYERMNDTNTLFIYNTYPFWVVIGMVLYLSGSFFVYIFTNFLSADELKKYWIITNIFSILKSILFTVAILIHAKPTRNTLNADLELSSLN
ncbi:MAG TPA: hypothetical protein VMR70_21085 [Flavisolibacter sp.]|nr:hypothetical protein [Flavisolibacter sp.]